MSPIHWKSTDADRTSADPWFPRAMGLLGLIAGYALHQLLPYIL
jgi:hypothetical protein